jgi:hypothetical protein
MVSLDRPRYQYCVDRDDKIKSINAWWLAFARENGANELTEQSVVGSCLWDFVADEETRRLYQGIHTHLREHGKTVVLPFHCDSPTVRRHMQLTITGMAADGELSYEGVVIRVEPRQHLAVLDPLRPRTDSFLWMCSCCKRALLETRGWLETEEISNRLHLYEKEKLPSLRQTICPLCKKAMTDTIC